MTRQNSTARSKKARALERAGIGLSRVKYPYTFLDKLVRWGYLPHKETFSRKEIDDGFTKMVAVADAQEINSNALRCPYCGRSKINE